MSEPRQKLIKEIIKDLEQIESEVFESTSYIYYSLEKWKKRLKKE